MSDEDEEVYAYSDDGGSDAEYAYGSDEVRGVWGRVCGVSLGGGVLWGLLVCDVCGGRVGACCGVCMWERRALLPPPGCWL
jgi:hypothetical protein